MDGNQSVLVQAIHQRNLLSTYRDQKYEELIYRLNTNAANIIKDDLGSNFVMNCGHDFAGEIVRNCFDTSDYYITVDQLATRILKFTYEDEYDPLSESNNTETIRKSIYNHNDIASSTLDSIQENLNQGQAQLFTEDRASDKLDLKGKKAYRESQRDVNGNIYDELTGNKGTTTTVTRNGKNVEKSDLHADHIQAREAAKYNSQYVTQQGAATLRAFWNSADNMQMMHASANTSKGDVRVCEVNGRVEYKNTKDSTYDPATDITHKATPKKLADATISQWEKGDIDSPKVKKLIEQGYLVKDEQGNVHVPKAIRIKLEENIRHSQNAESKIILQNTKYSEAAKDALSETKKSFGKILAGQILYYSAPPLVYEVRCILKDKKVKLDDALHRLGEAGKRVCKYLISHLGDIFKNILANSVKEFIKTFMDFLINMVKATVKKILKLAKNLLLAVVDAVKIIATPGTTPAQKGDAVFNLFGITVTNFVIDILFEAIENGLHLPSFVLMPLQLLTSVICSNLVMLILQKADLFDVRFGFKMNAIRNLFEQENQQYQADMELASTLVNANVEELLAIAERDCRNIYDNLIEIDVTEQSVRESLEKCNTMFMMNIHFNDAWAEFIGQKPILLDS